MNSRKITTFAACATLAFGVAACGGDDEEPAGGGAAAETQTEQTMPEPVAEIATIESGTTDVILDEGFVEALGSLELTPAPVGDGTIEEGTATFPVTGGNVTYYEPGSVSPYVQGELMHEGSGLSLTGGGKTVELTDFVIDPGTSTLTGTVSVDGEVAADSAPLFFLDGNTLEPLQTEGSDAILEGTTVKLKAEAADLLNETFGVDALEEGLVIGTARITVPTGA